MALVSGAAVVLSLFGAFAFDFTTGQVIATVSLAWFAFVSGLIAARADALIEAGR